MNFREWSGVKGLDKRGGVNYRSEEAFEKQHPTCHSRNHLKGSKKGKKVSCYRLSIATRIFLNLPIYFWRVAVDYKGKVYVLKAGVSWVCLVVILELGILPRRTNCWQLSWILPEQLDGRQQ